LSSSEVAYGWLGCSDRCIAVACMQPKKIACYYSCPQADDDEIIRETHF